jgi:stage II sporulation protein AA (anti-sigma F factor antagonist)
MAQVNITFQDVKQGAKAIKLIAFTGQLDETNVDAEAQKIYRIIEEMAEPNLLFDFANLEYMNSKSIGYLTDWYSKVMAKNGKIVITRPRANILDILKVVGITQIINIHDNLDKAKESFTQTAVA